MDFNILQTTVNKMAIGFSHDITIYCPMCGHPHTYNIEYSDLGLLGSVNLFEILDLTLRLAKTMNYQIQDNMPWMEVEILQEAANKIAEEERKQLEKDNGKITMNRSMI